MNNQSTPTIIEMTAKRIDYLRIQTNLSVRDLAKKSGIATSAMYNIISGTKVPNIYTLHSICNALQISLSDFFNLDDTVIAL